jgi:putative colanic acid biosynthesis acetyltransferase WcaF
MNKVDFSRYNHVLFISFSLKLKYVLWLICSNIIFLTNIPYPNNLKVFILRCFGAKIGKVAIIKPWVKIKFPWLLSIGDHVWLGESCWIDNISSVNIGNNVCISQGALLLTGNHDYTQIDFPLNSKSIIIEDGVWIGAKCIVVGGVLIETHAVLNTHSVASRNLEPYSINQGHPAIKIKSRFVIDKAL